MKNFLPYFLLTSGLLFTLKFTSYANGLPIGQVISSPSADTCPSIFSFTVSSSNTAVVSNASPTATTLNLCHGGQMVVSMLTSDGSTANLRFIEQMNSDGNVAFEGIPVPAQRTPTDVGIEYFNRTYGAYTLLNLNTPGTLRETFTPYIDLNNDRQFNPETECLGQPATFIYNVNTMLPPNQTVIYSVKTGIWNDPSVWYCGRIPQISDFVQVKHVVTIPTSYQATAMQITFDASRRLLFNMDSSVRLGQ
ncbi:hypothetical protein GCM10027592_22990 [Spirosoma flavus]